MNIRFFHLLLSVVIGFVFWQVMIILSDVFEGTGFHRLFLLLGSSSGVGFLKLIIYIAFTYAMIDLSVKFKVIHHERNGFQLDILAHEQYFTLSGAEIFRDQLAVLEKKGKRFIILELLRKTSTHFIGSDSPSDTIRVLEMEVSNFKNHDEGKLEITRYIIQALPMVGFCASILELSHSLTLIDSGSPAKVRDAMSGAFDTTLISLALTLVLMYFYHRFVEEMDHFFSRLSSLVMENFVSKIRK